ncbi:hypothetical protein LCGC14_2395850, partial [marine sediment metagenome]
DFLFKKINNFQDFSEIKLQMVASSSLSLGTGLTFECFDYSTGSFVSIPYNIAGNLITIDIPSSSFGDLLNIDGEILLKFKKESSVIFDFSIDSFFSEGLKDWNVVHDLYRASFEFSLNRDIPSPSDFMSFVLSDQIFINIQDDDSSLNENAIPLITDKNVVSFNYDTTTQFWKVYLNSDLRLSLYDSSPRNIIPRVEIYYSNINEGIELNSLKSQFFMKIKDEYDFNKYKLIVDAYNTDTHMSSYLIDILDEKIIPENTFTQISSDIDVIYSFDDTMSPNSIFNYDLSPTFSDEQEYDYDSNGYTFEETGLTTNNNIILGYSYVDNHYGYDYYTTSQQIEHLQDEGNIYTFQDLSPAISEIFFTFPDYLTGSSTITLNPDGDVLTQWSGSSSGDHYLKLDEYPSFSSGDYVTTLGDNKIEEFTFEDATIFNVKKITRIDVWAAEENMATLPQDAKVSWDGGQSYSTKDDPDQTVPIIFDITDNRYTWSGLDYTLDDLRSLQVQMVSDKGPYFGEPQSTWLYRLYVKIYYDYWVPFNP